MLGSTGNVVQLSPAELVDLGNALIEREAGDRLQPWVGPGRHPHPSDPLAMDSNSLANGLESNDETRFS